MMHGNLKAFGEMPISRSLKMIRSSGAACLNAWSSTRACRRSLAMGTSRPPRLPLDAPLTRWMVSVTVRQVIADYLYEAVLPPLAGARSAGVALFSSFPKRQRNVPTSRRVGDHDRTRRLPDGADAHR